MTIYRARDPNLLSRCAACSVPFNGETAQEELDRRINADRAHPEKIAALVQASLPTR